MNWREKIFYLVIFLTRVDTSVVLIFKDSKDTHRFLIFRLKKCTKMIDCHVLFYSRLIDITLDIKINPYYHWYISINLLTILTLVTQLLFHCINQKHTVLSKALSFFLLFETVKLSQISPKYGTTHHFINVPQPCQVLI